MWNFIKNAGALYEYKYRYRRGHDYMKGIEERKKILGPSNPSDYNYRIMSGKLEEEKYIEFFNSLKLFVSSAGSAGCNVLVVLIPDAVQLNDPHMQALNHLVMQACNDMDVPFTDMTKVLERQEDWGSLYMFPFDAHNSPKGLRLIGKSIAEKIIELHLLSIRMQENIS